jgi:hypothetical protein
LSGQTVSLEIVLCETLKLFSMSRIGSPALRRLMASFGCAAPNQPSSGFQFVGDPASRQRLSPDARALQIAFAYNATSGLAVWPASPTTSRGVIVKPQPRLGMFLRCVIA